MELTMTNGFSELSINEMEMIDGGGWKNWLQKAVGVTYMTAGAVVCVAQPEFAWAGGMMFEFGVGCVA